jgi:hypothetical protein
MISFELFLERRLTGAEETKRDEIVKAMKKDEKDELEDDAIYAIATAKAKESA